MNIRPLSESEAMGLALLNEMGIPNTLVYLTDTGLSKSILDATETVRKFLRDHDLHDFATQQQGQDHKVEMDCLILQRDQVHKSRVSFYRPQTKKGDPRFWPSCYNAYARGNDVIAVVLCNGSLGLINLSRVDSVSMGDKGTVLGALLESLEQVNKSTALELLAMLREVAAKGPIKSIGAGDTTIGMTIERALGIAPNSSRLPDYKGIEIKLSRSRKAKSHQTRATLFACVPNWELSRLKSSAEILAEFGYARGDDFKLYCTVSSLRPNSQGLFLKVAEAEQLLREVSGFPEEIDVAVWEIGRLEAQLARKHRETFWVKARAEKRDGIEWFQLESVVHTRSPNVPHLQRLLTDGGVTVDHLIKRVPSGGAREKGPLFKVERERIAELFYGVPKSYTLIP